MSIEYPDLAAFLAVAESVTGIEADALLRSTKLDLADSALHAPQGGWDDQDFYPADLGQLAPPDLTGGPQCPVHAEDAFDSVGDDVQPTYRSPPVRVGP